MSLSRFRTNTPVIAVYIAINVTVYAAMAAQAVFHLAKQGFSLRGFVETLNSPLVDPNNFGWDLLLSAGHLSEYGEVWRVATASIVHLDAAHITFNMLAIYFMGQAVERYAGHKITLAMVLASAGTGALACLIFEADATMGGASTVGYGILAMLVGIKIHHREQITTVIVMVVIYFAWTFYTPGVSLWGHVGGFIGGGLIYLAARGTLGRTPGPDQLRRAELSTTLIGVGTLLAAGAVGVLN